MAAEPDGGTSSEATRVLIIDDDPEIREVVTWLLQDEGLPVETAHPGSPNALAID